MSNRAISAVLDYSRTKGSQRVLMFVIADGMSKDTGRYFAHTATLMHQCGDIDRRYLHRLINKLIACGELIVFGRGNQPSDFMIPIFEGELGYDPQECKDQSHFCNGKHTPLDVSREDVKREEIQRNRRQQRAQRRGLLTTATAPAQGSIDPPTTQSDPRRGLLTPPGWSIDPPRVVSGPPQGGLLTPQYPFPTPSLTPVLPSGVPLQEIDGAAEAEAEAEPDPSPRCAAPLPDEEGTDHLDTADSDRKPAPQTWRKVCDLLLQSKALTSAQADSWLSPAQLMGIVGEAGAYVLVARTGIAANMLRSRFLSRIESALTETTGVRSYVRVEVAQ